LSDAWWSPSHQPCCVASAARVICAAETRAAWSVTRRTLVTLTGNMRGLASSSVAIWSLSNDADGYASPIAFVNVTSCPSVWPKTSFSAACSVNVYVVTGWRSPLTMIDELFTRRWRRPMSGVTVTSASMSCPGAIAFVIDAQIESDGRQRCGSLEHVARASANTPYVLKP
jgi:hypothetical protein